MSGHSFLRCITPRPPATPRRPGGCPAISPTPGAARSGSASFSFWLRFACACFVTPSAGVFPFSHCGSSGASGFVTPTTWIFLFSRCGSSRLFFFLFVCFFLCVCLRHSVYVDLPIFPLWIVPFFFFVRLASSLRLRGFSHLPTVDLPVLFFGASGFVTPTTWIFLFSHCGSSVFFFLVRLASSLRLRGSSCFPIVGLPVLLFCASGFVTPSTWIFPFSHCGSSRSFFVRLASSLRLRGSSHFPIVDRPVLYCCCCFVRLASSLRLRGFSHFPTVDLPVLFFGASGFVTPTMWIFLFSHCGSSRFCFFVRLASPLRLRGSSSFPIVGLPVFCFSFLCVWLRHSDYVDLPLFLIVGLPVFPFCASGFVTPSAWVFPFFHCGSSGIGFWCVWLRHSDYVDLPVFPLWVFPFFFFLVRLASSLRLRGSSCFPIVGLPVLLFCASGFVTPSTWIFPFSHCGSSCFLLLLFFCASGFVTPSTWMFPFSHCGSSCFALVFFFGASGFVTPSAWVFPFSHCGSSGIVFWCVWLRHSDYVDLPVFPLWVFPFFLLFCLCVFGFVTPSAWIFPFSHCGSSCFVFLCVWLRHSVCVDLPIFLFCIFPFFFCASCFVTPSTWIFPFSHCGSSRCSFFVCLASSLRLRGSSHFSIVDRPVLYCCCFLCVWLRHSVCVGFPIFPLWIFRFCFLVRLASSLRLRGSSCFAIVGLPVVFVFLCVWLRHSDYVDLPLFPLWVFPFFFFVRLASSLRLRGCSHFPIVDRPVLYCCYFFVRLASSLRLRGSSCFPIVDLPFLSWCVLLRHSVYVDLPVFPLWIFFSFLVRLASSLRLRGSFHFPIVDRPVLYCFFLCVRLRHSFCVGFPIFPLWIFGFVFWCVWLRHSDYVDLPVFPLWIFLFVFFCASCFGTPSTWIFPFSHCGSSRSFCFCASGFVTPSTWIFPFSHCGSSCFLLLLFFCASGFVTPSAWVFHFSHCGSSGIFFWCVLLRHSVYVDLPVLPLWIFPLFFFCVLLRHFVYVDLPILIVAFLFFVRLASSLRLRGSSCFPIVDRPVLYCCCFFVRLASSLRLRGSSCFPIVDLPVFFFCLLACFVTPSAWIFLFSYCGSSRSFSFCASGFVTPSTCIFPFSHCGSSCFCFFLSVWLRHCVCVDLPIFPLWIFLFPVFCDCSFFCLLACFVTLSAWIFLFSHCGSSFFFFASGFVTPSA